MAFNLSDKIDSLNSAMFPQENTANGSLLSAFGGESTGFAKGISHSNMFC